MARGRYEWQAESIPGLQPGIWQRSQMLSEALESHRPSAATLPRLFGSTVRLSAARYAEPILDVLGQFVSAAPFLNASATL